MKLLRSNFTIVVLAFLLGAHPVFSVEAATGEVNANVANRVRADRAELEEILAYRNLDLNEALRGLIQTLSPATAAQVGRVLDGVYVVDYQQEAPELLKAVTGQISLPDMKFPYLYDNAHDPYYAKFELGWQILLGSSGPLTVDLIRNLHRQAIGYDANGSSEPGGMIRMRHVYGPEFDQGLTDDVIQTINSNPYLRFLPGLKIYADVVKNPELARIGSRTHGVTVYPRLIDVKDEALDRIRDLNPALIAKITEYRRRYPNTTQDRDPQLTQQMVTAFLEERISSFEKEAASLGPIRTGSDVQRYIQLITRFQRDYVSIHPFADGNGRTSRLILNFLAHRQRLPKVRFIDPNEDDESTLEEWTALVQEGMHSTALLEQDFLRRINLNLPVETSVALFSPALPLIRYSPAALDQFKTYLVSRLNAPEEAAQFARQPVQTLRQLRSAYGD